MNTYPSFSTKEGSTTQSTGAENIGSIFNSVFSVELAKSTAAINEVFEVRYQVYCIDRPFEDPNCFIDKREHDAYDPRSVHALIRHRSSNQGIAAVRLVLADEAGGQTSFPMEAPCLDRMSSAAQKALAQVPRHRVAEMSRLAVSRDFRKRLNENKTTSGISDSVCYTDIDGGQRAMPYISLGLFAAIVRMSVENGITHWLAVMEPTLLRLLKRYGIAFDHVGATVEYHGRRKPVFTEAAALLDGIRMQRPDVWSLITEDGRYLPERPPAKATEANQFIKIKSPAEIYLTKPDTKLTTKRPMVA